MSGANQRKYINELKDINQKVDDFVGEGGDAEVLQNHQITMEYKLDALLGVLTENFFKLLWFLLLPTKMKRNYIMAISNKMILEDRKATEELKHEEKVERMQIQQLAKQTVAAKKIPKRLKTIEGGKKDD